MTMNERATQAHDEDWLDQALRAQGREHRSSYVADDGFTARVMTALPQPATLPAWRAPAIALLWLCAGVAAAVSLPGLFDDVFRGAVGMFVGHRLGLADIAGVLILLGATTWGALLYAARTD
jgi:hypothetical protein